MPKATETSPPTRLPSKAKPQPAGRSTFRPSALAVTLQPHGARYIRRNRAVRTPLFARSNAFFVCPSSPICSWKHGVCVSMFAVSTTRGLLTKPTPESQPGRFASAWIDSFGAMAGWKLPASM